MSTFKKILDSTNLDELLAEKTGIDLNKFDIDDNQFAEIKKVIGSNIDKVDLSAVSKKLGVSEEIIKKVAATLNK